ncbi:sensor domain-containing protein [Mycobacterium sp. SMC-4]|uniref:sensor domain-containing protein n=1 Tax=Mycobacterium sp. SMC-4 TaxID=2857059 RepID=UPI0021B4A2B6|nr:sensor domain-containing protein [Mycobacterium sp. SMC-4]UXA19694.1 sensor domain-containing protein [Mycobacterium sp. SMC-4]
MTARRRASARHAWRRGCLLGGLAALLVGCAQTVDGTAVRSAPVPGENSRSPVNVDTVLLDRAQMQAITGAGQDLTPIPGMQSKVPVDIEYLMDTVAAQCRWVFAETQVFGVEVEEFQKTTYQNPPDRGVISQAAAGYRDTGTARRAFGALAESIRQCASSNQGPTIVGAVSTTEDSVGTRAGGCGRDYRVKSAVLVEVTFCAFPESVPDIVMSNIIANVPG